MNIFLVSHFVKDCCQYFLKIQTFLDISLVFCRIAFETVSDISSILETSIVCLLWLSCVIYCN